MSGPPLDGAGGIDRHLGRRERYNTSGPLRGSFENPVTELDIQTGGREVLVRAPVIPPVVVADPDEPPLPFADGAFDLVTSRDPATAGWDEIARVLRPGGTYLAHLAVPGACPPRPH